MYGRQNVCETKYFQKKFLHGFIFAIRSIYLRKIVSNLTDHVKETNMDIIIILCLFTIIILSLLINNNIICYSSFFHFALYY